MGGEGRWSRDAAAVLPYGSLLLSPASGSIMSLVLDNAALSGMET